MPSERVLPPSLTVGLGSTAEPVHAWSGIASTDALETSRSSGFGLSGSGFGLSGSGFGLSGFGLSGFGLSGSGFGLSGSGFGLSGSGFGLSGSGFGLSGSGLSSRLRSMPSPQVPARPLESP